MEPPSNALCGRCRDIDLSDALLEWRVPSPFSSSRFVFPKFNMLVPIDDTLAPDQFCFLCGNLPKEPGLLCSLSHSEMFDRETVSSAPDSFPHAAVPLAYHLDDPPSQLPYHIRGPSSPLPSGLLCIDPNCFSERFQADILLKWLYHCKSNHACGQINTDPLAHRIRLIDCHKRCTTPGDGLETYVALSYVWGSLDRSELDGLREGQLPDQMPRTVEDAMEVTRMLGLRYLWVDAYCIKHTASSTLHEQMGQMDAVYGRAHLTLIAAAGQDAESGLPGVCSPHMPFLRHGNVCLVPCYPKTPKQSINASRWATRGWTYQEALLSRRRLVFTQDLIYFECNQMSCWRAKWLPSLGLDSDTGLEKELKARSGKGPAVWNASIRNNDDTTAAKGQLLDSIRAYTKRNLSYASDSLNGFRGILNHYRTLTGGKLRDLWGLPYEEDEPSSLVPSLCWYHDESSHDADSVQISRRAGFPSWSWAGWSGAVTTMRSDGFCQRDMELVAAQDGALGPDSILEVDTVFLKTAMARQSLMRIHAASDTRTFELSREIIENSPEYRLALAATWGCFREKLCAIILQQTPKARFYARVGVVFISPNFSRYEEVAQVFYKRLVEGQPRQSIFLE